ncbi:MAG: polyketide cyclase [Caulobacter sp.]|nr:polyketide cyclase [Caulobacter sp.]
MKRNLLISLTIGLTLMGGAAGARPVPASAEATLQSGKPWVTVAASGEATAILGAIDIAATPRAVWAVLVDCGQARRIISNLKLCRVVDKGPGWDVREQVTAGNMFVPDIRNVFRAEYQPYSRITFHRTGGDLKVMRGEWRLEALDGGRRTRVIYENRVDAEVNLPAGMVRAGIKADCGKVLVNLRRVVVEG